MTASVSQKPSSSPLQPQTFGARTDLAKNNKACINKKWQDFIHVVLNKRLYIMKLEVKIHRLQS